MFISPEGGNISLALIANFKWRGAAPQNEIAVGRRKAGGELGELVSRLPLFISLRAVPGMMTSGVSLLQGRLEQTARSEPHYSSLRVRAVGGQGHL